MWGSGLTISNKIDQNHRIICVGRDLQRSLVQSSAQSRSKENEVAQGLAQSDCLQEWKVNKFSGKPDLVRPGLSGQG